MEETKKVKINIEIAGTNFPMEVLNVQERYYRIGREQVNALRNSYTLKLHSHLQHGILDPVDVWKLVAMQCATNAALDADVSTTLLNHMDAFTQEIGQLLNEADQAGFSHPVTF